MSATSNDHARSLALQASPGRPVIVACDGRPATQESLFNAARLVAGALDESVEVLGVCEPTPAVAAGMDVIPVPVELDEMRRSSMLVDIQRRLSSSADGDPSWPIAVKVGSPSRTLASEAAQRHASMLIMGIGRHSPLDRLFGTETTLATLRESAVPVLAVGMIFPGAPTRVVVGMDFSAPSLQAAQLSIKLAAPGGHVTLVHVRPRFEHPSADWQAWDADYGKTLPKLFDQVLHELDAPTTVIVDTVTLRGDPAPALLAFAQQEHADLIAMGTQRRGLIERLVVGSVATRVLRATRNAVLAVPGAAVNAMTAPAAGVFGDGKVA